MNFDIDYTAPGAQADSANRPATEQSQGNAQQPFKNGRPDLLVVSDDSHFKRQGISSPVDNPGVNLNAPKIGGKLFSCFDKPPRAAQLSFADHSLNQPLLLDDIENPKSLKPIASFDGTEAGEKMVIEDSNTFGNEKTSKLKQFIKKLDNLDQHHSKKIHNSSSMAFELILTIFAHFFNRIYALIGFVISLIVGYFRYDVMLESLGFKPAEPDITSGKKWRLALAWMLFYGFVLLLNVMSTQMLKYAIKRKRPTPNPEVARINNLAKAEHGTPAMPSGDSAAGGVWCFIYCFVMQVPAMYIGLPLVMLGRIYYQCHWIGDTIAGALIGSTWGLICYTQFGIFLPILKLVAGENTFIPVVA